jgi:BRCT domain type II-containing protein
LDKKTLSKPKSVEGEKRIMATFIITGVLEHIERGVAIQKAIQSSHHYTAELSEYTTHLVVGDRPDGKKLIKAHKMGIQCISEDEFLGMLCNQSGDNG